MKKKQIKDDELLYLPSSLNMKNNNRQKQEFDFTYSNHKTEQNYTLQYDTVNKKAIEFIYSNHKDNIDYKWYYQSRQTHKFGVLYSTHRSKYEDYFEYLLKRPLNYIFKYIMYPKYGRYIFIYDITSIIHNEDNVVNLVKEDKRSRNERVDALSGIDGYDIVYENVINGLEDVDKTIEEYCNYLQIRNLTGNARNVSLFATNTPLRNEDAVSRDIITDGTRIEFARTPSRDITQDGDRIEFARSPSRNIHEDSTNIEFARNVSRDISTDTLYDFMISSSSQNNKEINVKDSLSMTRKANDSKDISYYLKNDTTMRKIVDMMYAEKLSEKYLHHSHLNETIIENNIFAKEDDKSILHHEDSKILRDYFENESTITDSQYNRQLDEDVKTGGLATESIYEIPIFKDVKSGDLRKEDLNNPLIKGERNSPIYCDKTNESSFGRVQSRYLDKNEHTSLDRADGRYVEQFEDIDLNRIGSSGINFENYVLFERFGSKGFDTYKESFAKRESSDSNTNDEDKHVNKADYSLIEKEDDIHHINKPLIKTLKEDFEDRLNLHKRFWFVKTMGKIDYKILPNVDYSYPADINIFVEKPDFEYLFEYDCEYVDINSDSLTIELYDYNYKKYENFKINTINNGEYKNDNITVNIEVNGNKAKFTFKIKHKDLYYIIVRQPLDVNGYPVLYTATKKFLGDNKHPIPFGSDMGVLEIPVHINVMVDFINILLLMWSKFYYQFTGYTGVHAVYGLVNLVYEWLTLETSDDIYELDDYHRCFRWLRWEAEKVYNLARYDANLSGNAWVEKLIYELIEYMEMHHMDIMPVFEPNHIMDEYRNIFNDPSFDIDIVLDKVKGVRKRVIDTNKVDRTQKNN